MAKIMRLSLWFICRVFAGLRRTYTNFTGFLAAHLQEPIKVTHKGTLKGILKGSLKGMLLLGLPQVLTYFKTQSLSGSASIGPKVSGLGFGV